jgi:predicted hydrocarbon binding protein
VKREELINMRYNETGELHFDFHAATNVTLEHIGKKFGDGALKAVLFNVGHDVYKSIREKLSLGDVSELLEFWEYFLRRENGEYTIKERNDEIILSITKCPAVAHIKALGHKLSPSFCKQTEYMNLGLCEGTPYMIETRKTGEGSCVQVLKKRIKEEI